MNHSFDVNVAEKYGVHAAVLLQNITFWCLKNKANGVDEHNGLYWTYNSKKAFAELFPYLTARQVEYALKKLIDDGAIITGNFNASAYDKTLWYAVTEKGFSLQQNCEIGQREKLNGGAQNVEPIPDVNPNVNPNLFKVSKGAGSNCENQSVVFTSDKSKNDKPKSEKRQSFDAIIEAYTQNEELQQALKDFVQMRVCIKKPMTNRSLELMLKRLDALAANNTEKIAVLNQSIMCSWQGIFPLREEERRTTTYDDGKEPNWYRE